MFSKGDKIYSIVAMKCPRCHEGKLWKSPLYKMKFYDMYDNCPVCGLKYEQEPGFWYGAMYMGYTFSSGALLVVNAHSFVWFKMGLTPNFHRCRYYRSYWVYIQYAFVTFGRG